MKKVYFLLLLPMFFLGGCGLVSILSTPTASEMFHKAQYDLDERLDGNILVIVEQGSGVSVANFRPYLTKYINAFLIEKAGVKKDAIVDYVTISKYRSGHAEFSGLSPAAKGMALGAEKVLLVVVADYGLYEQGGSGYYKGLLTSRSFLFDVESGQVEWPRDGGGRSVSVGVDSEAGADDSAVRMLSKSTAHCIVRYLYDCAKDKFKASAEVVDDELKYW